MSITIWTPDLVDQAYERCANDFGRFSYDGFGIMLSDEQIEAASKIGTPGPVGPQESKFNFVSGGQRSGKTVESFLWHANAGLYKRGVDPNDALYWDNYQYGTLHIAPSTELYLRMWTIADEIQKGANDAQFDRKVRRARGGAFLNEFSVGKSGDWGIIRFENGAHTDFRSSEGRATRLEGGQWWFITFDEWASQPPRELRSVLYDVLLGRARDHNAKIVPMAWPKPETEYLLVEVMREIESGKARDHKVVFLSAAKAYFTNKDALGVERRTKTKEEWKRTVEGRPAGGASVVFKPPVVVNAIKEDLTYPVLPERSGAYFYMSSWDVALSHDSNVGFTWRIPVINGRKMVTPEHKARIVNATEIVGSEDLTLDRLAFGIINEGTMYGSQTAIDATAMGGIASFRAIRNMTPTPWAFQSRGQDRLWGNLRTAAIVNGIDCLSWGRTDDPDKPWGLVEMPKITKLNDQLANFDDVAKDIPDDWVWAFLIGLWYIRRHWTVGEPGSYQVQSFDVRRSVEAVQSPDTITRKRSPIIEGPSGLVLIAPKDPFTGVRPRVTVPAARRS